MDNYIVLLSGKIGTVIVLETNKEKLDACGLNIENLLPYESGCNISKEEANNLTSGKDTPVINLTGKNKLHYKSGQVFKVEINSLNLISTLHCFFPNRRFVLVKRWDRNVDYDEDYFMMMESDDAKEYFNEELKRDIEFNTVVDEITITANNTKDSRVRTAEDMGVSQDDYIDQFGPDAEKIEEYPGAICCETLGIYNDPWEYDKLYIYEEEIYNNLEVETPNDSLSLIKGVKCAPRFVLDVIEYKHAVEFL